MADERKVKLDVLVKAVPNRFGGDYDDDPEMTYEAAAYRLATYLFDQVDMGIGREDLDNLKNHLPHDLYILTLEKYTMGDHDT